MLRLRSIAVGVLAVLALSVSAPVALAADGQDAIPNPFTPPAQVQTGPQTATAASTSSGGDGISTAVQVLILGLGTALLAGIFLVIRNDARRTTQGKRRRISRTPPSRARARGTAATTPERLSGQELHHRRKDRARARGKAQRQARKRSR